MYENATNLMDSIIYANKVLEIIEKAKWPNDESRWLYRKIYYSPKETPYPEPLPQINPLHDPDYNAMLDPEIKKEFNVTHVKPIVEKKKK